EKMLYDNALLARSYLATFQVTSERFYRRIAEQTLDYVLREMTAPTGGFYSTQDADSEGVEGKFFVWTGAQLVEALGPDEAEVAARYWDVSEHGNWEHTNILNLKDDPAEVARAMGITADELRRMIDRIRPKLFARREQRIRPGRDEKVLTSWNGLMLRPKDLYDNATPSANSVAAELLLRLSLLSGEQSYWDRAVASLERIGEVAARAPQAFGRWLCAVDFATGEPIEVAIVGDPES